MYNQLLIFLKFCEFFYLNILGPFPIARAGSIPEGGGGGGGGGRGGGGGAGGTGEREKRVASIEN